MTRCPECRNIIWPWQKKFIGTPLYHATCDRKKFRKSCEKMNELHQARFNKYWMEDQIAKREKHYY